MQIIKIRNKSFPWHNSIILKFSFFIFYNETNFLTLSENSAGRIDERESAVKASSRREIGKRSSVRHEGGGVPMSRMENDPPLYIYPGVSRSFRFPSTRSAATFPLIQQWFNSDVLFTPVVAAKKPVGGYRAVLHNPAKGKRKRGMKGRTRQGEGRERSGKEKRKRAA